jgi:hypothetical protein
MMRSEFTSDGSGVKNSNLFTTWTVTAHQIIDTRIAAFILSFVLLHTTIFMLLVTVSNPPQHPPTAPHPHHGQWVFLRLS